ncbi:hypothetical protein GGR52DRAFT_399902 [Hypoxylon sp. FL1284]|nr:hypothetical protein GGR52DRAFT_399902 [Hypoxylon sp. FL1284]
MMITSRHVACSLVWSSPSPSQQLSTPFPPPLELGINNSVALLFSERQLEATWHISALQLLPLSHDQIISFPDPPRPPTPGPPPRPPPIPPRPPVPTPPPSPRSAAETEWLYGLVAKQFSVLAVQLVNAWLAPGAQISFPYPDRPPTPGPRSVANGHPMLLLGVVLALKHGLRSCSLPWCHPLPYLELLSHAIPN